MLALAQSHVMDLEPYVAGQSAEEVRRRFKLESITKLASNENPLGASPLAIEAAQKALKDGHLYPNFQRSSLKERICQLHTTEGIVPEQIVLGNGSNEIITLLARGFLGPNEALLNAWPSFIVYRSAAQSVGVKVYNIPLLSDFSYNLDEMAKQAFLAKDTPVKMLFLANPNNPTGQYVSHEELTRFLYSIPEHVIVVLDEAYTQYVEQPDYAQGLKFIHTRPRTVVLRTFSKIYGLAGFRVGYAVCDPKIANLLHRIRDPFNLNGIAMSAATAALDDKVFIENAYVSNLSERQWLVQHLTQLGLQVTPSVGNFILLHFPLPYKGSDIFYRLMAMGVIVRPLDNYDLPQAVRVTVGTRQQNDHFLQALKAVLSAG